MLNSRDISLLRDDVERNVRTFLAMCEAQGLKVLVTRFDDVPYENYTALVDTLRGAGVRASLYLGSKKFGKQIDYAVKGNYSHVAIMGGDELAAGNVKLKNLASREEATVAMTVESVAEEVVTGGTGGKE